MTDQQLFYFFIFFEIVCWPAATSSMGFNQINNQRMEGGVIKAVFLKCVVGFVIMDMERRHISYASERGKLKAKRPHHQGQLLQCYVSLKLNKNNNNADNITYRFLYVFT